jgi:hypothetical protein
MFHQFMNERSQGDLAGAAREIVARQRDTTPRAEPSEMLRGRLPHRLTDRSPGYLSRRTRDRWSETRARSGT